MLSSIQETYGNNASTASMTERYAGCDLLFIDDLGKESTSAWTVGMLFQIINVRYESMRPIIFTSQFPLESLCARFSKRGEKETADAIASRIYETCEFLRLGGPDRRRS